MNAALFVALYSLLKLYWKIFDFRSTFDFYWGIASPSQGQAFSQILDLFL
jgi:hypothetical protein